MGEKTTQVHTSSRARGVGLGGNQAGAAGAEPSSDEPMTHEQIHERVERTLERNQAAVKQTRSRSQRLSRAAERSASILDRAFKQLRQGS